MAEGLQIWDAAGNNILDTTTRVGFVLGLVNIGKTDGYIENNNLGQGTPFYTVTPYYEGLISLALPTVTISQVNGNWRLSWTWAQSGADSNSACQLIYGIR